MDRQQGKLIQSICQILTDKYVFPKIAERAETELLNRMENGAYELSDTALAETITRDLQAITSDAHLRVVYDPERVASMRRASESGSRPDVSKLARRNNHGFARVECLKGNIGYADIRHFFSPRISGDTSAAAMRFIADADAVIIDLRNNTGGNPNMVQFLCSYFVGGETPVLLNTITSRLQPTTTEYWANPDVPGKRMPDVDLTILTSSHTFSGGEELAYNMKHLKRATLIGETTAGGANPAGIDILSDDFYVTIPHATPTNPVTGTNWEGCGVNPDIEAHPADALEIAHTRAITRLIERESNEAARTRLEWFLEEVETSYHPIDVPLSILKQYVGQYGDTQVLLERNLLIYKRRFFRYQLIPLSETTFWLDGPAAGFEARVKFVTDETGTPSQLVGRFPDGRSITKQWLATGS